MKVVCPHCGAYRIVSSKLRRDVVVVLSCPACHELVVLFRDKVLAIDRKIIKSGTFEEKKSHISHIVAELLESGIFPLPMDGEFDETSDFLPDEAPMESLADLEEDTEDDPISQNEFKQFVEIDLDRIDDAAYFKKHFE